MPSIDIFFIIDFSPAGCYDLHRRLHDFTVGIERRRASCATGDRPEVVVMTRRKIVRSIVSFLIAAPASLLVSCPTDPADHRLPPSFENMIIEHTCTDLSLIPDSWVEAANGRPAGLFAVNFDGLAASGELDFRDRPWQGWLQYGRDLGSATYENNSTLVDQDYLGWFYTTRRYLGWTCASGDGTHLADYATGTPAYNGSCDVVMWAWCGQAGYNDTDSHIENYLQNMTRLEIDYPEVFFVYMTGHTDGSGLDGNLHQNNEIIREYCRTNGKILYDFEDIESWDPNGNYYGDRFVTAACNYDANSSGATEQTGESTGAPPTPLNGDRNWALDWQNRHTLGVDWYECYLTWYHTQHLNDNLKAYAMWWLLARLAGWNG
jgi:hypothetical protein